MEFDDLAPRKQISEDSQLRFHEIDFDDSLKDQTKFIDISSNSWVRNDKMYPSVANDDGIPPLDTKQTSFQRCLFSHQPGGELNHLEKDIIQTPGYKKFPRNDNRRAISPVQRNSSQFHQVGQPYQRLETFRKLRMTRDSAQNCIHRSKSIGESGSLLTSSNHFSSMTHESGSQKFRKLPSFEMKPPFVSHMDFNDRTKFKSSFSEKLDLEKEVAIYDKQTIGEKEFDKICSSSNHPGNNKNDGDHTKVFDNFENWLAENGAMFPSLYMKAYSKDVRGVHANKFIDSYQTIVSIPVKCLITDYMGRHMTKLGQKVFQSGMNPNLSTPNLIAVILYILETRRDPNHFFQPYYKILPKSYESFPIFWNEEKLAWLQGSPLLKDIHERKKNMKADYLELCRVCPEFNTYSFDEFLEIRTAVGSRNFGIVIAGEKRTAMVPFADMLNHYRPRETSWTFENTKDAFTITSIAPIHPGQQVMDSYGKKCNSKFFLHYGFAVERNREEDGKCQNEISLTFGMTVDSKKSFPRSLNVELSEERMRMNKIEYLSNKYGLMINNSSFLAKTFRISMNFEDRGTADAMGFLRAKVADERSWACIMSREQMFLTKHHTDPYFYKGRLLSLGFISKFNEIEMLKKLAAYCSDLLKKYPKTYEENLKLLNSGLIPAFSDRRTALVVVIGEQEICNFWIYAQKMLTPILSLNVSDQEIIRRLSFLQTSTSDRARDLFRYAMFIADRMQRASP